MFSMDFSRVVKNKYDYSQKLTGTSMGTFSEEEVKSEMSAKGTITIDVKKDQTADMILSDVDIHSKVCCVEGEPIEKNASDLPPTTFSGLKKDGSFASKLIDPAFGMLFRMPKEPIKMGQKLSIPMTMPIRVGDWDMDARGNLDITYLKNEMYKGRDCAVLKGDFDISQVKIPAELKGEVKCDNTGKVTYYFDRDKNCFVKVDMEINIYNLVRVDKKPNENMDSQNKFTSKISLHLQK